MFNRSFVRLKGLEPPRREASDPKSDVATNYTTAALEIGYKGNAFFYTSKYMVKKMIVFIHFLQFCLVSIELHVR